MAQGEAHRYRFSVSLPAGRRRQLPGRVERGHLPVVGHRADATAPSTTGPRTVRRRAARRPPGRPRLRRRDHGRPCAPSATSRPRRQKAKAGIGRRDGHLPAALQHRPERHGAVARRSGSCCTAGQAHAAQGRRACGCTVTLPAPGAAGARRRAARHGPPEPAGDGRTPASSRCAAPCASRLRRGSLAVIRPRRRPRWPGRYNSYRPRRISHAFAYAQRSHRRLPALRAPARRCCASSNGRTSRSASSTATARSSPSRTAARTTTARWPKASSIRTTCTVECPRHGSLFDLQTGKPLTLPAYVPVDTFPVVVEDDIDQAGGGLRPWPQRPRRPSSSRPRRPRSRTSAPTTPSATASTTPRTTSTRRRRA